jgi:signal transduction histidine kinase/ligand-binding sensor domain-containing protein
MLMQRADVSRPAFAALLALTLVLTVGARADALDAGRTLTQYAHRIWQVTQGLPQASIYAVVQTSDGRLWLGTQTGLVRFDGVRFTTIDEMNGVSLADVWVTQLVEDHQHALWIGTDASGVFRLQDGVLTRFSTRDGLPSDAVQCVFEDHGGRMWVCTANGLAMWNGRSFETFVPPDHPALRNVTAACDTPDRRLWVVHDGRMLDTWSAGRHAERSITLAKSGAIRSMMCARSGDVWMGTTDGVFQVTGDGEHHLTTADRLADNGVLTLAESRDGAVLVGTSNGFSRIRGRDIESFRAQDGLSQSAVYALYEDHEGTLWVATGHGLNQFLDGRAIPYTTSEGLPSNNTGPIVQDHRGTIWTGTLGAGLARFDGHGFSTLTTRDGLASNNVLALAEDPGGNLWVGTDHGLNRVRDGRVDGAWTTARGLPSDTVRALIVDASGALSIATTRGAAIFRRGVVEPIAGSSASIAALGADKEGRLYIAPEDGSLQVYSAGALTSVADNQLALRHVDAMYTDKEGVVWIGTAGDGLLAIDHGRIRRYSVRDGLFDDSIYAILGDDHGRLWMACSKGIFSVDRAQLLRFAPDRTPKVVSTPYSPTDVLRTIECKPGVQPAAWSGSNGQLWFSTTRGLLVLDSKNADRRFDAPPAAIDDITVNGERARSMSEVGTLLPGRNNVAFRYTGLSFIVPTRITFKYTLEGFDAKWVDAGTRREAFYTNLPPGHFRFRVSACNLDGECHEAASAVAFVVEPRYYQRAWFIPLCVVGVALAGLTGYRLRIRRLREQFDLILAERTRIARELHDTLIQGFSGITMAMQALAARLPASGDRHTLEQIVADAGTALREARASLSGLRRRPEADSGLALALAQTSRQLTEAKGIRLKLRLDTWDRTLPPDLEDNLLRIAQEAVLNAVKHSGAHSLLVTLERTANRVRLVIQDDGSGFDGRTAGEAGHYGVLGMYERAAHIGADLSFDSTPGYGTAVSVTLDA